MNPTLAVLFAVGCVSDPPLETLPTPDPSTFETQVEPVFEASCANASCHARPDRPFSLYAPLRRRLDESRLFLDEPLTDEELAHNLTCAAAFLLDIAEPIDSDLLAKPLAEAWGGVAHQGGVQFADTEEPGFLAISDWIQLYLDESEGR